ncbi:MAG TPA: M48 family metallopeptidase [Chloroflexota bacterium]|nr:M48 family metallopeptidase [Chloroflexota bacterium]
MVAQQQAASPAAVTPWAERTPQGIPSVDEGHLISIRHPSEMPRLWLTAATLLSFVVVVSVTSEPWIALLVVALWVVLAVFLWLEFSKHVAHAAEITPRQFGHLYQVVEELRRRFGVPHTRVFVVQSPVLNAGAFGIKEPYAIVFHSALLETYSVGEFRFVLGHEMAHIRLGHTRRSLILGGGDVPLPAPLEWLDVIRKLIRSALDRAEERSCDRAGVLACGDVRTALSALTKLHVGPRLAHYVDLDELAKQALEIRGGASGWGARLNEMSHSHPLFLYRVRSVIEWAGLPARHPAPLPAPPAPESG